MAWRSQLCRVQRGTCTCGHAGLYAHEVWGLCKTTRPSAHSSERRGSHGFQREGECKTSSVELHRGTTGETDHDMPPKCMGSGSARLCGFTACAHMLGEGQQRPRTQSPTPRYGVFTVRSRWLARAPFACIQSCWHQRTCTSGGPVDPAAAWSSLQQVACDCRW
jgi:hypothetical protein